MARFVRGDVVVVPFPFSDLSQAKRRPALVLANLQGDDIILVQITSQAISDWYSVPLSDDDFLSGKLNRSSNIRPNRIFTADSAIIRYKIGSIQPKKLGETIAKVIEILSA